MGEKTGIEWTDATWNPIRGVQGNWHCTKVSAGCANCYAERMNIRMGGPAYKPGFDTFRLDEKILEDPLRWKWPRRIFTCSMTDLFHENIPVEWIARIFDVMSCATLSCQRRHKHEEECWEGDSHIFQALTKRPQRMLQVLGKELPEEVGNNWTGDSAISVSMDVQWPLPNVWLGVSVEDQKTADERCKPLRELAELGWLTWVSYEPSLGDVDWSGLEFIKWFVSGGESGPHARPPHPDWHRHARDWCKQNGIAYFFKQWGEFSPDMPWHLTKEDAFKQSGIAMFRVGKKAAGRLLDRKEHNAYPA